MNERKTKTFGKSYSTETERESQLVEREYVAEALEARILYSAAPVDMPAEVHEAPADVEATSNNQFQSLESFADHNLAMPEGESDISGSESVILSSTENLSSEEIQKLAESDGAGQDWLDAADVTIPKSFVDTEAIGAALKSAAELDSVEVSAFTEGTAFSGDIGVITQIQLDAIVGAAEQRWIATGLSNEQISALGSIEYRIEDLPNLYAGVAEGNLISLDIDASVRGWFIDTTPLDDSEFAVNDSSQLAMIAADAAGSIDLLTYVMHEQGHVLGLEDVYDSMSKTNLMYGSVQAGVRILPTDGLADGEVAGSVEGRVHAAFNPNVFTDDAVNTGDDATVFTLREAILAANATGDNDTITLLAGTYELGTDASTVNAGATANITEGTDEDAAATGDLDIVSAASGGTLTITGAGKDVTFIDANGLDRVFELLGGANLTLENLTITGGFVDETNGGGIFHNGGTAATAGLTLTNVKIENNTTEDTVDNNTNALGGGIYNNNGTITGTDVDFVGNKAVRNGGNETSGGGGIFSNGSLARTTLTDVNFINNTGREGGAIYIWSASDATPGDPRMTLNGATFIGNSADSNGGAIRMSTTNLAGQGDTDAALVMQHSTTSRQLAFDGALAAFTFAAGETVDNGAGASASIDHIIDAGDGTGVLILSNITGSFSDNDTLNFSGAGAALATANGGDTNRQTNFAENTTGSGGAIRTEGSNLQLSGEQGVADALIVNNSTTSVGGGLYIRTESHITLTDVTLSNNSASEGAGFQIEQKGSSLTGTRVTIEDNTATTRGGGFRNANIDAVVSLTDSVVQNNTANNEHGGGFYTGGTVNLINTDVTDNRTLDLDGGNRRDGYGAGFTAVQGSIVNIDENSSISDNAAYGHGGGFYNAGGTVNVKGTIENNWLIYNNQDRSGGGFWNQVGGTVNLDGATITGNQVSIDGSGNLQGSGGGFWNTDQSTVNINTRGTTATTISGNLAEQGGGFYSTSDGSVINMKGTSANPILIKDNWARVDGGGFIVNSQTHQLDASYVTVSGNVADVRDGGGIAIFNGVVRAEHFTVENNYAGDGPTDNNSDDGGGIYIDNQADVVFTDTIVRNNTAADDGGGVYIEGETVGVRFENSVITSNDSGIDFDSATGFVQLDTTDLGGDGRIDDITFNVGDQTTAGLAAIDTNSNPDDLNNGGGIAVYERGILTLVNSTVSGNAALGHGGGIYAENDSLLTVQGSLVSGNLSGHQNNGSAPVYLAGARHGGGIYMRERVQTVIENTVILNNESAGDGGGLYQDGDSRAIIRRTTFEGNVADEDGGGFYRTNFWGEAVIENSTFTDNWAGFRRATTDDGTIGGSGDAAEDTARDGGGLFHNDGYLTIVHSTFTDNEAADDGGGIRTSGTASRTRIENSIVAENRGDQEVSGNTQTNNIDTGATSTYNDNYARRDGTLLTFDATSGAAAGVEVGAGQTGSNPVGSGDEAATSGTMTVWTPNVTETNVINKATQLRSAQDQSGAGRDAAGPHDFGAVETSATATGLSLAEFAFARRVADPDNPLTANYVAGSRLLQVGADSSGGNVLGGFSNNFYAMWSGGEAITLFAAADSTSSNQLNFNWSVTGLEGGLTTVDAASVSHTVDAVANGIETDTFTFTPTLVGTNAFDEINVNLTISDSVTNQAVSVVGRIRVINPDFTSAAPADVTVNTTADTAEHIKTLSFDGGVDATPFAVGEVITEQGSGLQATVISVDSGNGAAGTVTVEFRNGNTFLQIGQFTDNAVLDGSIRGAGAATVNGTTTLSLREAVFAANQSASGDFIIGFDSSLDNAPIDIQIASVGNIRDQRIDSIDPGSTFNIGDIISYENGTRFATIKSVQKDATSNDVILGVSGQTGGNFQNNLAVMAYSSTVTAAITGASNATPIVITTSDTTGLTTGDEVFIQGVVGNTAANGLHTITVIDGTSFSLDGVAGNGAYTSGGAWNLVTASGALSDNVPNDDFNSSGDFDVRKTNGAVVFRGNGRLGSGTETIIDGNNLDRVFDVKELTHIFFEDMVIRGGETLAGTGGSDHGAGIRTNGGVIVTNEVDVVDNYSARGGGNVGGGIYVTNSVTRAGGLFMTDSTVSQNIADDHGGGIYVSGAMQSQSVINLDNVTIASNEASNSDSGADGGGIYFTGQRNVAIFNDVTIHDNNSRDDGGGFIFVGSENQVFFNNSAITGNSVSRIDRGGGTAGPDETMAPDTMHSILQIADYTERSSDRDGGGGLTAGTNNYFSFTDTTFGGALDTSGTLTVVHFDGVGGGGSVGGTIPFEIGELVTFSGGATGTIEEIVVTARNSPGNDTGLPQRGYLVLSGATGGVADNETFSGGNSGHTGTANQASLLLDGGTDTSIAGTTGLANILRAGLGANGNFAADDGGGLAVKGVTDVIFTDTVFQGNISNDDGGGFLVEGGSTVIFNEDDGVSEIKDNRTVDQQGGGFTNRSGTLHITGVSIADNRAGTYVYDDGRNPGDRVGGGFYNLSGGTVNLTDVSITGNQAEGRGGGFYTDRGTVNIDGSTDSRTDNTITGNRQVENSTNRGGGAIYVSNQGAVVNIADATIKDNRSNDQGGGIHSISGGRANLSNVEVSGNESRNQGGGIYVQSDQGIVTLDHVDLIGNASEVNHGGAINTNGRIYADTVLLQNNRTGWNLDGNSGSGALVASGTNNRVGGAMYVEGAEAAFIGVNVSIDSNFSHGRGGGVYVNDGLLDLTNFSISNNRTTLSSGTNGSNGRGGGIWLSDRGTADLENGTIHHNVSVGHGGGIYMQTDGTILNATNVTISNNWSGYQLGAPTDNNAFAFSTPTTVFDSGSDGGGVFMTSGGSVANFTHVTFTQNVAADDGGGLDRDGGFLTYRDSILSGNIRNNAAESGLAGDNNATATLEGRVIITFNTGGTLTQTNGTRLATAANLEDLANNGYESNVLTFTQTVGQTDFIAGETVTGAISGATARILSVHDLVSKKIILLTDIVGTFEAMGEAITSASGAGTTSGGLATITSLPGGINLLTHALAPGSPAQGQGSSPAAASVLSDARGARRGIARDLGAYQGSAARFDENPAGTDLVTLSSTTINQNESITVSGDVFYDLITGETGKDLNVTIDWGDGTATSSQLLPSGTDFSGTPDFSGISHTYGVAGSHTVTVSLSIEGSDAAIDTYTEVITVNALTGTNQTVTTTEDSTVTFNESQVVATGELGSILPANLDLTDGNRMGWAVDVASGATGTWAVIGGEGQGNQEEVAVYKKDGSGNWILQQIIVNPRGERTTGNLEDKGNVYDDFGYSVAVDAENGRLFIGAPLDDTEGNPDKGSVHFYELNDGNAVGEQWEAKQVIRFANRANDDRDNFGHSLDVRGDILAVGAFVDDGGVGNPIADTGALWVFRYDSGLNGGTFNDSTAHAGGAIGVDTGYQELRPTDPQPGDRFGDFVQISENGTYIAVGAEYEDDDTSSGNGNPDRFGSVFVFNIADPGTNGAYAEQQKIENPDKDNDDNFGHSLGITEISTDGTARLVVGSSLDDDDNGTNSGAIYIYEFNTTTPNTWTLEQTIDDDDEAGGIPNFSSDDRFGRSVDIAGDVILVGAHLEDSAGSNSGKSFVFTYDSVTTNEFRYTQSLVGTADARDEFGLSVSIDKNTTTGEYNYLVGARLADPVGVTKSGVNYDYTSWGAAHMFTSASAGAEVTQDTAVDFAGDTVKEADFGLSDPNRQFDVGNSAQFGRRVALGDGWALVGAPQSGLDAGEADGQGLNTGRAYLYQLNDAGTVNTDDDVWQLVATVAPPASDDGEDLFGFGVAISEDGSTIAVGAFNHEGAGGGSDTGAVYVYSNSGGTVTFEGRVRADNRTNDDEFGRYLSLNEDGSTLAVGMYLDDDLDSASGAVLVYDRGASWTNFFSGAPTENGVPSVNSDGIKLKPISEFSNVQSDNFGRTVAISGDLLVVGAMDDDHMAGQNDSDPDNDNDADDDQRDRGSVYVYRRDAGTGLHAVLDPDVTGANSHAQLNFSSSDGAVTQVVIDGTTGGTLGVSESGGVVTINLATGGSTAAAIAALDYSAITGGTFSAELFLGNMAANEVAGSPGVPGNDGSGNLTADTSVTLTPWKLEQKLVGDDQIGLGGIGQDDRFGWGVDVDASSGTGTIVVGARQEDTSGGDRGSAYVFEYNSGGTAGRLWEQVQQIQASDRSNSDLLGRSVSIDGDVIVAGAEGEDALGDSAGSAYVFQRDTSQSVGSQWSETAILRGGIVDPTGSAEGTANPVGYGADSDNFGLSVGVSNGQILVGSFQSDRILPDGTTIDSFGAAFTYRVETATPITGIVSAPAKGSASFDAGSGTITFDPGSAFQDLDVGDTENVSMQYSTASGTVDVTITVTGRNDGPAVVNDTATAIQGGSVVNIPLTDDDTDVDLDHTYTVIVPATSNLGATLSVQGSPGTNVSVDYTPDPAATGTDSFSYFITSDGAPPQAAVSFDASDVSPGQLQNQTGGFGLDDGTVWNNTGTISAISGDLTYNNAGYTVTQEPGGFGGNGQAVRGNYFDNRSLDRTLETALTGEVWFSYLVNNPNINDPGDPNAEAKGGISLNSTGNSNDFEVIAWGQHLVVDLPGVAEPDYSNYASPSQPTAVIEDVFTFGQTSLVMGKIDITNGTIDVWVDPDLTDPTSLDTTTYSGTATFTDITHLAIVSYSETTTSTSTNAGVVDAIRLDNTSYAVSGVGYGRVTVDIKSPPTFDTLPASITAEEDLASNVDLSGSTLSDADTTTAIILTLTTDGTNPGTLTATDGGGVTVSGSGTGTLTLTGTVTDLNTYLSTASAVQYTGSSNVNGTGIDNISLTGNDQDQNTNVDLGDISVNINAVNDAPNFHFEDGGNTVSEVVVLEDAGNTDDNASYTYNSFVVVDDNGAANESGQTITGYTIENNTNSGLFQSIGITGGNLTFTTATNAFGFADITVRVTDDGAEDRPTGNNASYDDRTFRITVDPVSDNPTFNLGHSEGTSNPTDEAFALTRFADMVKRLFPTATSVVIDPAPAESPAPVGTFSLDGNTLTLPDAEVAIDDIENIVFDPDEANSAWNGTLRLQYQVRLPDNSLSPATPLIYATQAPVEAPLVAGSQVTVPQDSGNVQLPNFAQVDLGDSPAGLRFDVGATNPGLFGNAPSLGLDGSLSFTPSPGSFGSSVVTLTLTDGNQAFGSQSFLVIVTGNPTSPGNGGGGITFTGSSFFDLSRLVTQSPVFDLFGRDNHIGLTSGGDGSLILGFSGGGSSFDPDAVIQSLIGGSNPAGSSVILFPNLANFQEALQQIVTGELGNAYRVFDVDRLDVAIHGGERRAPEEENDDSEDSEVQFDVGGETGDDSSTEANQPETVNPANRSDSIAEEEKEEESGNLEVQGNE